MSYIPTRHTGLSTPVPPFAHYVLHYLPAPVCSRRAYVWAPSKLLPRLRRDQTFGRSGTDGRPCRLRSKNAVTSHIVTFACVWLVMYGIV
eukprot:6194041-Pleurochrysis_carterae.AAC.1